MINLSTSLILPDILYHGTSLGAILNPDGFRKQVINNNFMSSIDRDFGTGFYTTIDFRQAAQWARKHLLSAWENDNLEFPEHNLPVIVQLRCKPPENGEPVNVLDFRGESNKWSDFILLHRYKSSFNECYCRMIFGFDHPKIVCGPMADNDTGSVIALFKKSDKAIIEETDRSWFRDQITLTTTGYRREGLELGDQIAWFGEELNNFLSYDGYHKINIDRFLGNNVKDINYREEWDYVEPFH